MKKLWIILSVLSCFLFHGTTFAAEGDDLKPVSIGIIGDLSGPTSALAEMAYGIRDYFLYLNDKGGIKGHEIDFLLVDGAEVIPIEVSNYKRLITRQKPVLIFVWSTGASKALRRQVNKVDKIPIMSESMSEELVDPKSLPYNFIFGPTYEDQIRIGLDYAKSQGAKRIAFIGCNLDWCQSPRKRIIAEEYCKKLGMEFLTDMTYPARPTDLTSEMLRLKKLNPDFIWVNDSVEGSIATVRDANKVGLDVSKFFAVHWSKHDAIPKATGKAAEGYRSFMIIPDLAELKARKLKAGDEISEFLGKHRRKKAGTWYYVRGWLKGVTVVEAINNALGKTGNKVPNDIKKFRKMVRDELEGLVNFDCGGGLPLITYANHQGFIAAKIMQVKNGKWTPISEYLQIRK
ncbi:MAG: ABC transporter substrate-binding protein [Desulfatiglans sp.]|jgi:branched-chain amino acid transport system substrate-binding protein|nr:ABC transporter substrate-binding protein [Thermodesulfobacteriota bacterium]MEE4354202.1 ABC transporter substrate-binding protein [Desulfatiglans sp.]